MKKFMFTIMGLALIALQSKAQYYPDGRPIPPSKRAAYYASQNHNSSRGLYDTYVGFRLGMGLATVNSDSEYLDGNRVRTGLNAGIALGTQITSVAPLYFETGLYYTQKGGKSTYDNEKFTYQLDYLELPLVFKYRAEVGTNMTVDPFIGAFLSCGVGGKIKDYQYREAYSSFSSEYDDNFKRFDGGIRAGVGFSVDMFYAEASYDFGLANVGKDNFNDTHTGDFNLTVGVNF